MKTLIRHFFLILKKAYEAIIFFTVIFILLVMIFAIGNILSGKNGIQKEVDAYSNYLKINGDKSEQIPAKLTELRTHLENEMNGNTIQEFNIIILGITALIVLWYSVETRRLADLTEKQIKIKMRPLLSINVQSSQDKRYRTIFQLKNHRDIFTEVWVYAELKFNGDPRPISDHYNGKKSWLIQPQDNINAPIELPKVLLNSSFGYTGGEIEQFLNHVQSKNLTFKINVKYKGMESDSEEQRENPEINYHYSFQNQSWVLDVDVVRLI